MAIHKPKSAKAPMIETALPILSAAAAKEILKNSIGDLYDYVKSRTQRKLLRWNSETNIAKAYRKLLSIRKVKTLWQIDKAVDLTSFYCPSRVYIDEARCEVDTLDDLNLSENILIEGIAGQGKSILLRYLSAVETARGGKLPIFIELRLVQPGETIKSHIVEFLADLRIDCDEELFDYLMQSGRVVLLLDAFDELDEAAVLGVIKELEHFCIRYDTVKVVVTSRPNSGLKLSRFFHVVKLSDLEGDEYASVIRKLLEYSPLAEQLIARVSGGAATIRGLLTTPLLVTLLVLIYKSYQEIPSQMSEFYDSLFQLLLQRHDGTKPGFQRKRRCVGMNDGQYRKVFEAFCYGTKRLKQSAMRFQEIHDVAEKAFANVGESGDPEYFIKDIVGITCLILEEAGEYRFIHKSVQEFYAAYFLRRKPETVIQQLYPKMLTSESRWDNEVKFLQEIDTYRINKFGLLPALLRILGISEAAVESATPSTVLPGVRKWLGKVALLYGKDGKLAYLSVSMFDFPFKDHAVDALTGTGGEDLQTIDPAEFKGNKVEPGGEYHVMFEEATSKGVGVARFDIVTKKVAPVLLAEAQKLLKEIRREEKDTLLTAMF